MSKFKKGDKVRSVVNDGHMLTIGRTYIVTNVDEVYVWVENDEGENDYFYPKKFELFAEGVEDKPASKDNVNSPNHYTTSTIECIVAMEAMLSPEEFIGYLRGNIFKYQWRYKQKNGIEDLKKAQWYQNKLLEKEST